MDARKLTAEVLGTFALVFAGTCAIVVNDTTGGAVTHVGISLTFGLVVTALAYALGEVSGAHINPAVSLGCCLARRMPWSDLAPYVLSQCVGALLASSFLYSLFPAHSTLGATLPREGLVWQAFVLEIFLTWLLMFVILCVSGGSRDTAVMTALSAGTVVGLEALFAGPISGASMNPARSLGPAVVAGRLEHFWIYVTAPLLGACLAALSYWYFYGPSTKPAVVEEKAMTETVTLRRVLFVCVENSCRSQMAEAFARLHGFGKIEAFSAGSRPSGQVNPKAIASMRELDYDLAAHQSKGLDDLPGVEFDVAVTMGCGDACPMVKAKRRLDWQIPDPKHLSPDEFRAVRDQIERQVRALLSEL